MGKLEDSLLKGEEAAAGEGADKVVMLPAAAFASTTEMAAPVPPQPLSPGSS